MNTHQRSFILTAILISFTIPSSLSQYNQQFSECTNLYSCGENSNLQGIGYPFWGRSRPSSCGLPGFELRCRNDGVSTIDIDKQTFRVLDINQSLNMITLARDDLWDDVCPQQFINTTMNDTLFGYPPIPNAIQFLDLFYSCPSGSGVNNGIPVRNTFTCPSRDWNGIGFYDTGNPEECENNITVPVFQKALEEFRRNEAMSLEELLNQGFEVEYYRINKEGCLACELSEGLCWSGTNSSAPTCLYRDGPRHSVCQKSGNKINPGLKLAIGIGAAGIAIVSICCISYYIRKSSFSISATFSKRTENERNVEAFIMKYGSSTPKRYRYSDIKKMTNSFKDKLGRGGYGSVFKGRLPDNRLVAVKVLNSSKGNGDEFINEVASIGRTSHVNVVTLLGFCYEGRKRALIYEFMLNGSLERFIYRSNSLETGQHLGVNKLYEIALGIARGLEYLHRGCNTRILHLDIKPHNILLDKDFCPKISDFGLAKLYSREESIVSMLEARGTIGYIAPEVFSRNFGGVSHKSDVYSYGMMVLEMVGGRKNVDAGVVQTSEIYFPHWIYKRLELEGGLQLEGAMAMEENEIARKMIIVGLWCIQPYPTQRPSMNRVIEMLVGSMEALKVPPKPFFSSPPQSPVTSSTTLPIIYPFG